MDESLRRGSLARVPFARLLAEIWENELSGKLTVNSPEGPMGFTFDSGALIVDRRALAEKDFLQSLLTSGEVDLLSLARCEEYAEEHRVSPLKALLEIPLLDAGKLWSRLERFVRDEAFRLFDTEEAEFVFEPSSTPPGPALIRDAFLPNLVLEGGRRMANIRVIAGHLPPENEIIRNLSPYYLDLLDLAPQEKYLLDVLDQEKTLAELYAACDLGRRESQKILFIFLCLGIAGTRAAKPKTARLPAELTLADVDKLLGVFNTKCSAIYKYISKEIGPVASSVIEKALEDVRGRLDPVFQGFELNTDGRIELKSVLKTNMNLISDETRRSLCRSLDEILVAEVLAVKRTLGSVHEAALIKSLEKIGDVPS
jgi:hypothetical protein